MKKQEKTWTLKEVDSARGASKGTSFKAFKQLRDGFDEGRDFYYLNGEQDAAEVETLRVNHRLYDGSINAILLTESGYTAVMDFLDD